MLIPMPVVLFVLLASPLLAVGQAIEWKANRPLTWNDFKGTPHFNSGAGAVIYHTISYSYKREMRDSTPVFTFDIKSIFDGTTSWVKWNARTEYILAHEQLHFDIQELYARKLAVAFKTAVYTNNYDAEIKDIFSKIWTECNATEKRYDKEAEHGNNSNMQYRWQLYIYLEMMKLPRNY